MTEPQVGVDRAPRRPRRRIVLLGLVLVGTGALLVAAFSVVRPDLPPRSDFGFVSQLVAAGKVASLDLYNTTLIVRERTGGAVRVEGVTLEEWQGLFATAPRQYAMPSFSAGIRPGGDGLNLWVGQLTYIVIPLGELLVGLVLVRTIVRRLPGPRAG